MEILKYFRTSILQITSLLCVLGFLLGVLNLHFSDKTNHCIMTYMYEYPQFVRIHFSHNSDYPAYGLFAYGEGRLTEKARKMRFDGIPVLFLPGNAGSHMQARSLASVALRKALSKGYEYHFDYFTISYNEELTGFYGGTLNEQVEFASQCIKKILELYSNNKYTKSVPTHVIIIGHSMGGLVASRLLAHPDTLLSTKIAITLAAPLEAPVILFDSHHEEFYRDMESDWINFVANNPSVADKKMLISFGNGPRDVLVPSGLTSYNHSTVNILTTAVPGAWVSPDHVCIVWCKQIVMSINKYLFSLVDFNTQQIAEDMTFVRDKAKHFFVGNRRTTLDPASPIQNATMIGDAFWYEDNRRIYTVNRPNIEKMTYLMVRLVSFPQNRFVAIEGVNIDDPDWIFGCNAKHTYNVHRYCKQATSLSALSRWTGAADTFGKRKLATINLHQLKKQYPDWTHVIVKVSPSKKPITLNIDINDHASRRIEVTPPSLLFGRLKTIIPQTDAQSLYYEIVLKDFTTLPEAYLLNVEPVGTCEEYHVSAEVHVPWAENNEYYHYFTHLKRSPMKIRLFKTNTNVTLGEPATDYVKITLLLDPKCTFTVSISASWYHSLAQLVRNYTPVLIPYMVGIVIIAAASNIFYLWDTGSCVPIHTALDCEVVKPYYTVLLTKFTFFIIIHIPILTYLIEYSTFRNTELHWFVKSLLVFPAYMVALGVVNVVMAATLCAMAFSSQLDRFIFRIFWRTGISIGERLAYALRKVPMVLSGVMVAAVPMSCGAASLAIGAAFYAYLISKMFEDYFEDLVYKISAKVFSKLCRIFRRKPKTNVNGEEVNWSNLKELEREGRKNPKIKKEYNKEAKDEELSNLNFHMMMFSVWFIATLLNLPTLLAWARNFKYETKLRSDPSFAVGLLLSLCSGYIWQLDGPRKYLNHYTHVSGFLYATGIYVMVVGPFSLVAANYAVAAIFLTLTLQQLIDYEIDEDTFNELYGNDDKTANDPTTAGTSNTDENCRENEKRKRKRRPSERIHNYLRHILTFLDQKLGSNLIKNTVLDKNSENRYKKTNSHNSKEKTEPCNDVRNNETLDGGSENVNQEENKRKETESNTAGSSGENSIPNLSSESCDPCDENSIFDIFKNLKEKLSFSVENSVE